MKACPVMFHQGTIRLAKANAGECREHAEAQHSYPPPALLLAPLACFPALSYGSLHMASASRRRCLELKGLFCGPGRLAGKNIIHDAVQRMDVPESDRFAVVTSQLSDGGNANMSLLALAPELSPGFTFNIFDVGKAQRRQLNVVLILGSTRFSG